MRTGTSDIHRKKLYGLVTIKYTLQYKLVLFNTMWYQS
jgi:hypothetical protein